MMRIQVAVSNRHAHLSAEVAEVLGLEPRPEKWLGIGNNYASDTWVEAGGQRFRVLLPFRRYSQLEVLASDCRGLGIPVCYRNSGNLEGAPGLKVGEVTLPAIVALPHVHVPEVWLQRETAVDVHGRKKVTLNGLMMYPTSGCYVPVLHIDRDEAMAFGVEGEVTASMELRLAFQPWPGVVALEYWRAAARMCAVGT